MTFDPVLPPVVLAVVAAVLLGLRALSAGSAFRGGGWAPLRWASMTVAIALLLLAAARPASGIRNEVRAPSSAQGGENIYLVVDRSADSASPDFGDRPRMDGIRDDVRALIEAHPGARFALISFAARPAVDWPLSADSWSLRPVVAALEPAPGVDSDQGADQLNAAAAATVLRYQLISAAQQYPGSDSLVYYFGSGAPESSAPQGTFDVGRVDGGAVFGYGTDDVGVQRLRAIADQLGVRFVTRTPGQPLPPSASPADAPPSDGIAGERRDELYWLLTLVASALLLVELGWSLRELRSARSTARETLT
ncbi:VWA domain-containing protein [Mycolicibacterium sp. 018/SC-01/001]|uniref:VWA domain-containing protein n=1 Tax=Mycolicibacterium sp. 018/SC-01/001 TaxID=2592069 RepID=UPI00117EDF17|nr:VWA domain-containing protein [Mycolicibacterium sp. 018/SC-01/001]TRW86372.1 VWA domain-containing protein [Mycolicibacterium sp. 018/SC-01/001]